MPEERIPKSGLSEAEVIAQKIYLADTYVSVGKYERALTVLNEVLALDPEHYHAHLQAGFCFLHLNKPSETYREACEAVRLRPHAADGYRLLAYMYRDSKQYALALKQIDQALEISPGDSCMYNLRASIFLTMGNSRKAVAEAKTALSIQPESEHAAHILAIALCNQNRHTETLRLTYEALQRNPNSALAWYQKGVQLRLDHNYRAAKYALLQALAINPEMHEAKDQLDRVLVPSLPWYRPEKLLRLAIAAILILLLLAFMAATAGVAIILILLVRNQKVKMQIFPTSKLKMELYPWDITAWEKVQRIEATAFQGMEEAEAFLLEGQLDRARMALRPALRYAPQDPVIHQSCLTSIADQFFLKRWCWRFLFIILRAPRYATYIALFVLIYTALLWYAEAPLSKKSMIETILIITPVTLSCLFIFLRSCVYYLRWGLLHI